MNTGKHLNRILSFISLLTIINIVATIICFIALISGEDALPFLICVILFLSLYLSKVFLSAFIEIYDAVVNKQQI